jgi:hypothetical protein
MSLTKEERKIIEYGKKQGKTYEQSLSALAEYRSKQPETPLQPMGFLAAIRDIPSDIKEPGQGMVTAVSEGMQTSKETVGDVVSGEISPRAGAIKTIGAGLGAGTRVLGEAVMGGAKTLFSPGREQQISETVSSTVEDLLNTELAQNAVQKWETLSKEQQSVIEGLVGTTEGLTTMFGFGPVVNRFKNVLSRNSKTLLQQSDDILQKARRSNLTKDQGLSISKTGGLITKKGKEVLKDVRFNLSDIPENYETVLKRSSYDDVNRYFQQARNHMKNDKLDSPLELAGYKGEEAFDVISKARQKAIQGKKNILNEVADQRVSGNTINEVMSGGIQRLNEKFGVKVDANGTIRQAPGRIMTLDTADQKLMREYMSRLNSLGVAPTVREVDDFVDWAQSQLYKQSKTMSKYEVASEPVVRELQGITGDLNTRLKATVGNGYGEVNARIARLIELQDELSRALGADVRKGGGLMKRLFSPTSGNTRQIFNEIERETGIDLVKEATLAKFAMENVGDYKQMNLLQKFDETAKGATEIDWTRPGTIVNFLRERADLDGQELANEIIRRTQQNK